MYDRTRKQSQTNIITHTKQSHTNIITHKPYQTNYHKHKTVKPNIITHKPSQTNITHTNNITHKLSNTHTNKSISIFIRCFTNGIKFQLQIDTCMHNYILIITNTKLKLKKKKT